MEAYYDSASIMGETGEGDPEPIRKLITKMEKICQEQNIASHFVTQAKGTLAMDIYTKNMKEMSDVNPLARKKNICEEPIQIFERSYLDTIEQLSD